MECWSPCAWTAQSAILYEQSRQYITVAWDRHEHPHQSNGQVLTIWTQLCWDSGQSVHPTLALGRNTSWGTICSGICWCSYCPYSGRLCAGLVLGAVDLFPGADSELCARANGSPVGSRFYTGSSISDKESIVAAERSANAFPAPVQHTLPAAHLSRHASAHVARVGPRSVRCCAWPWVGAEERPTCSAWPWATAIPRR